MYIKYVNIDSLAQSQLLTYNKLFENSIQDKLSTNSDISYII